MKFLRKTISILILFGIFSSSYAQDSTYVQQNANIYRSEDGGQTWVASAGGFPAAGNITTFLEYKDEILASTSDQGLFVSNNTGKDWSKIGKGAPASISTLANRGEVLFAGSWHSGVAVSFDGGRNWQKRNFGLTNLEVTSFFVSGNLVFAGTSAGIFYTWNDGNIWMPVYSDVHITGFTQFGSKIYASTALGVLQSEDYGQHWKSVLCNNGVRSLYSNTYGVFALTHREGIFKSENGDGPWVTSNIGLPNSNLTVLSLIQSGHRLLAVYRDSLFLSITGGGNWTETGNTLPSNTLGGRLLELKNGVLLASMANGGC